VGLVSSGTSLAMVIGEVRHVSSIMPENSSSTVASASRLNASAGFHQLQQQYVLVARICTKANGTNMKLHHQALLVRRRHLLSQMMIPRNYQITVNPYNLQQPLPPRSSNDGDAKEEGMDDGTLPSPYDCLPLLRPGCGPPPYDVDSFSS
jgi:hypothetical protein